MTVTREKLEAAKAKLAPTTIGHWLLPYGQSIDTDGAYGFVYEIKNKLNGKKYIGSKTYHKRSKGNITGPSDWKDYTGSSKYLNEDIEMLGKDQFEFRILFESSSKAWLAYAEMALQFQLNVVYAKNDDGDYKYYNRNIGNLKLFASSEEADVMLERIRGATHD